MLLLDTYDRAQKSFLDDLRTLPIVNLNLTPKPKPSLTRLM